MVFCAETLLDPFSVVSTRGRSLEEKVSLHPHCQVGGSVQVEQEPRLYPIKPRHDAPPKRRDRAKNPGKSPGELRSIGLVTKGRWQKRTGAAALCLVSAVNKGTLQSLAEASCPQSLQIWKHKWHDMFMF